MFERVVNSLRQRAKAWIVIAAAVVLTTAGNARAQHGRAPLRTPDNNVRYFVWSYKEIKERQVVMQKYDYSCGAAVLATIIKYYWGDRKANEAMILDLLPKLKLTEKELEDRIENGLTLTDLRNLTNLAGYQASMAKVKFEELAQGKVPVVVGITVRGHEHFAVFRGADERYAYLADPIRGNVRTPICDFIDQWQKNAILVIAKPNTPVKKHNPMGIYVDEYYRGGTNRQYVRQDGLMPKTPLWTPIGP